MNTAEEILKRNIRDANKTALIIFIVLNTFSILNYLYYIITDMNSETMTIFGSIIGGTKFLLNAIACCLIWKYNDKDTRWLKHVIISTLFISCILASFSYFAMFWASFFVVIGFSVCYCSKWFTCGVGLCSILTAAVQNLLMIPYGLKAGFVNMNFLALSKDATLTIKGGYMGIYNAVMASGLVNLDMAYEEAISESIVPLTTMLGYTILCTYMASYNKKTINIEISAIESIAQAKAEQLIKEKEHNKQLQDALTENEAQLEEIRALNTSLEESQAQLEESQAQLEETLEFAKAANESKTIFLNNMSHDIRTPMNAILGFTKLIEKDINNSDALREHLKKINYSGEYLLTIINDILDMARIDSGKVTLDEAFVDLDQAHGAIASIFDASAKRKNITINYGWDIQHQYVYVDKVKAEQIAMNLVSNAIKYTPNGGVIDIRVKENPCAIQGYTTLSLTVKDTGIGMSEEYQQHLFEAFSRERNTTMSKVIGTGLGMAIVKKLVDLMHGEIFVQSELGKGSIFTVKINVRIGETPVQLLNGQDEARALDFTGKRILLAEDNELNAEIAMALLEEEDFIVEHAEDGVECIDMLNKAEAGYFDLILMDIQMPNLNGLEATQKIRRLSDKNKADIPIIAMTANAFDEDKQKALNAGMNGFCTKPFDMNQLNQELSRVLKK